MNSLSSSDKLKYVNDLNNNVICANIATTNNMYQAMITQHQEEVIKDMRRKHEKERMQNIRVANGHTKRLQRGCDKEQKKEKRRQKL